MRVIVVGGGEVGDYLVKNMVLEGHDVTVIDSNMATLKELLNNYDIKGICGNGAIDTIQDEAGVSRTDMLIAVTSRDELNILCCLVAKSKGAKHTVARVRDPEYSEQFSFMKEQLGIDLMVNPEQAAAYEISKLLRFTSAIKVERFLNGKADLVEIKVNENSLLKGLAISEMQSKLKVKVLVCAVLREDKIILPDGNFILNAGDRINITASTYEIYDFFKKLRITNHKIKSIMIVGGGKIAYYLAKLMSKMGNKVKIIDKDKARCVELMELLDNVTIIYGNGADMRLLEEEGIDNVDAFLALTGSDEENLVISLFASKIENLKVITKIDNDSLKDILESVHLESIITARQITASQIVRFARTLKVPHGSGVISLNKLAEGKAEALTFNINKNSDFVSCRIKDIKFKKDLLIACILRDKEIIVPDGFTVLCEYDIIVVVTSLQKIAQLEDILE